MVAKLHYLKTNHPIIPPTEAAPKFLLKRPHFSLQKKKSSNEREELQVL